MGTKKVYIYAKENDGKKYITAEYGGVDNAQIDVEYFDWIQFHNTLEDSVQIKFRKKNESQDTGFCFLKKSTPLSTKSKEHSNCFIWKGAGEYKYSVLSTTAYEPLDPVIIIEPKFQYYAFSAIGLLVVAWVITAFVRRNKDD